MRNSIFYYEYWIHRKDAIYKLVSAKGKDEIENVHNRLLLEQYRFVINFLMEDDFFNEKFIFLCRSTENVTDNHLLCCIFNFQLNFPIELNVF